MLHPSQPRRCTHRAYLMTCEGFAALEQRANACCEICGIAASATVQRMLNIDHVPALGAWAVRGLLCNRCNTQLDAHVHNLDADKVARYLATPWYQHLLDEAGVEAQLPEPSDGSVLVDASGKQWRRTGAKWVPSDRRARPISWANLLQVRGPHLLRPP